MARIFKPNVELITAQMAEATARSGGRGGDIRRYDWHEEGKDGSDGMNYLRMCPPWSERGMIGFQSYEWFFKFLNKGGTHLLLTWPDRGMEDPIEVVIKKLMEDYPALREELEKIRPALRFHCNCIDRLDEGAGPKLVRMPATLFNWYLVERQNMINKLGYDPGDPEQGVDFQVKKSEKIRGYYSQTFLGSVTKDGLIPTVTPLHADPAVWNGWCDNLYQIERIIHFPDDAKLAEYVNMADQVRVHYERKARELMYRPPVRPGAPEPPITGPAPRAQAPVAPPVSSVQVRPTAPAAVPAAQPYRVVEPPPPLPPANSPPMPPSPQGSVEYAVATIASQQPPPAPRPAPVVQPAIGAGTMAPRAVPPMAPPHGPPPAAASPMAKPTCFGQHSTMSVNPATAGKCLCCPEEFACVDISIPGTDTLDNEVPF